MLEATCTPGTRLRASVAIHAEQESPGRQVARQSLKPGGKPFGVWDEIAFGIPIRTHHTVIECDELVSSIE